MADEGDREKYKVPLFDGTNFDNWKFRIETLLTEFDLIQYIEKSYKDMVEILDSDTAQQLAVKEVLLVKHKKKDRKCTSQIVQRIADSHLEYAKDQETAFGIWQSLCNTFERKGIAGQLLTRKALLTMKFNASKDTLSSHLLKFDKLIRELRSTGAKLEESDIVCHLLLTMPAEYDTVVTAIETLSMKELTVSFVKNRLLDEESKRKDLQRKPKSEVQSSTAFSSQTGNNPANKYKKSNQNKGQQSGQQSGQQRFPFACNNCGIKGHKAADCRRKPQGNWNNNTKTANVASEADSTKTGEAPSYCFPAFAENGTERQINWLLDSGASEHFAGNNVPLENIKNLSNPINIKIAKSGTFLQARQARDIEVVSTVEGKENTVKIKDVLVVPGLQYNLLSVPKLEMNGFRITFVNGKGLIEKDNVTVAVALRKNSQVYLLSFRYREANANACTSTESLELWHKRMGHLNIDSLKCLQGQVDGIKGDFTKSSMEMCQTCIEGKQSQQPHNQARIRAKCPLQLVHSDLFGPVSPTSYDERKYVLTFVDDYTHFTAAYILKHKSEVFHYFKIFEAMATAHFNLKLSRFRCDNGREYISNEIKKFFEEKRI
ncbi:Copia protein [Cyphomyrmex costatus]|uniref:Copia protein n=1 Tax=Cyphomyrmex costatus TaxID=456900 RepID=A0A151I6G2_9HYME|nr:Copia protein [Cyphomyrmex costatus]